jgi:hypothetical protein
LFNLYKAKYYNNCICCVSGCEIFFIPREEHRLRVYQNRMLRRIFGSEKNGSSNRRKRTSEIVLFIQY